MRRVFRTMSGVCAVTVMLSSCVSFEMNRFDSQSPVDDAAEHSLRVGEASLTDCLDRLGAPLVVREWRAGAELIWGWQSDTGGNMSVSIPVSDNANGSVSYTLQQSTAKGITLRFDGGWVLQDKRRGMLRDLVTLKRAPAQLVD